MKRLLILSITVIGVLAGLHAAAALDRGPKSVVAAAPSAARPDTTELDRLIRLFSERVERGAPAHLSRIELGRLYLHRARLTSDVADYDRAAMALSRAHDTDTRPVVTVPLAQAQVALHDFTAALATLQDISREDEQALAVAFDARLGIGDTDSAASILDDLRGLRPGDPAVIVRASELAHLTGQPTVAVDRALEALDASRAADRGADLAFYESTAARALLRVGRYTEAADLAADATIRDPAASSAWLLLARCQAAQGDLDSALASARRAAEMTPDPATLAFLADVHFARGEAETADRELDAIEAVAGLDQVAHRRAIALARAEHGRSLDEALAAAEAELADRGDPYAHHLMATVLHALGRSEEAESHAVLALVTEDAEVWYRAGVVAAANHDDALAAERLEHALMISPEFHPLHADEARQLLTEVGA